MKILWTKEALIRLHEIEEYITSDNALKGAQFIDKIISAAETLAEYPDKGRVVPEFSINHIRELLYKNYRIVYYRKKTRIEILTVFEGHQLLKNEEINRTVKRKKT